eukprot:4728751-Prymnesium_polylepis.1
MRGVSCQNNASIETLVIERQHWRLSPTTLKIWRCKSIGDWSPCLGGVEAGDDGAGYCESGYHGAKCEL